MAWRLAQLGFRWLLVVAIVATSVAAPAQAAQVAVQATVAPPMEAPADPMPCGDMAPPADGDTAGTPCDCCTSADCDLSACIGTACMPGLARRVAAAPGASVPAPWNVPAPPSRLLDAPLRPPIG